MAQSMRHAACYKGKTHCQMGACRTPHVAEAELYGKWLETCGMPHVLKAKRIAKWGHAACRMLRRQNFMANGSKRAACRMF
jgi:hypothetical protein